jgi:hypothetical protein
MKHKLSLIYYETFRALKNTKKLNVLLNIKYERTLSFIILYKIQ